MKHQEHFPLNDKEKALLHMEEEKLGQPLKELTGGPAYSMCFACGSDGFWDNGPFHERLPNVVLPNTLTNADKIGAGLTVAAMAGVTVHAVISSVQKSRHAKNESEHDEK